MPTADTVVEVTAEPNFAGSTLRIVGDVGPVLESTCVWDPQANMGNNSGLIRPIEVGHVATQFGLGAGIFGSPPEHAIQQLGEYVLIGGTSWWTPAAPVTNSRCVATHATLLTPFLFHWDNVASVRATLKSPTALPLIQWYDSLLSRLEQQGLCETGAIAIELVAEIQAGMVVDKHLSRAPLVDNRPIDHLLITDERHIDEYFLRDAVRHALAATDPCTIVMIGVAVRPPLVMSHWGDEVLRRGFYATPGTSTRSTVVHHTHATVIAGGGASQAALLDVQDGAPHAMASVARQVAAGGLGAYVVHVESDSLLSLAHARIGVIEAVELE
jgi:hypothetical protein